MSAEQILQWVGLATTITWGLTGLGTSIYRRIGEVRREEYFRWAQLEGSLKHGGIPPYDPGADDPGSTLDVPKLPPGGSKDDNQRPRA